MSFTKRQLTLFFVGHVLLGLLFLAPSYVRPDSVGIFSWLRSLVVDGDLLFFNEWAGFRMVKDGFTFYKEITPVGALANHWWVGTSILTAPFYLPSHGLSLVLAGESFPTDGFFGLDLVTLAWASVLFHALTLMLAFQALGQIAGTGVKTRLVLPTLVFTSLGTSAFWESFRMPLGTHAAGMMLVGFLTYLCIREVKPVRVDGDSRAAGSPETPDRDPMGGLFLIGITFGLAVVTRLQHVVLFPAVLYVITRARRPKPEVAAAFAGALIPLFVQGAAWFAIYGTPFGPLLTGANLEGVTWMPFRSFAFFPVLFSSWRGLFVWSPIWAPALAGLVLLAGDKRSAFRRDVGVVCLLMFAGELFANATLDRYWWGGTSFGARRFVDLAVPVAVGLWSFLSRTRLAGLLVSAFATAWSCLLMLAVFAGTLDLARYVDGDAILLSVSSIGSAFSFDELHSPFTSWNLTLQSALAISVIGLVVASIWRLIRIRPGMAARLSASWVAVCLIAVLLAFNPTRERAQPERIRFNLTGEAALSVGPLIDQRGLISDELAWLEATGRVEDAARTREEIERIDRELARLGVGR